LIDNAESIFPQIKAGLGPLFWKEAIWLPVSLACSGMITLEEWNPMIQWKAGIEDSIVGRLLSRFSLLPHQAQGGSLLQTCAPKRHSY